MTPDAACGKCAFFVLSQRADPAKGVATDLGFCHRFPPVPIVPMPGSVQTHRPMVASVHWCGEYALNLVLPGG